MQTESKRTARRWAQGLITHLLEWCHGMWSCRNGIVHEKDSYGVPVQEVADLDAEIIRQFEIGADTLSHEDKHLLHEKTQDERLNDDSNNKRLWVDATLLARQFYTGILDQENTQMRNVMQAWLATAS